MNCEQVQACLVSYLNHETTQSERDLIAAHIKSCKECQLLLDRLSAVEQQLGPALQRRASLTALSPAAWEEFEARLAQEAPQTRDSIFTHLTSGVTLKIKHLFSGDESIMKKRNTYAIGLTAFAILITVAAGVLTNVTQVSASTILDRAAVVQTLPAQGIQHVRITNMTNPDALPEEQIPNVIEDSYFDLSSCNSRRVTVNSKSGVVMDAFANDGTYIYSGVNYDINASGLLTVYRNPKDPANNACLKPYQGNGRDLYDQMRDKQNAKMIGQETWPDGRTVYVLQAETQVVILKEGQQTEKPGVLLGYFDTQTYQFVGGTSAVYADDGKTLIIVSKSTISVELLPQDSSEKWDLSDVQGIQIIDDPDGSHRSDGTKG